MDAETALAAEEQETSAPSVIDQTEQPASDQGVTEEAKAPPAETIPKSRFNEVYREKKQAERRIAELEQKLQPPPNAPAVTDQVPRLEDFDYDDAKYQDAVINYRVNAAISKVETERNRKAAEDRSTAVMQTFNTRSAQYAAQNPEYDDLEKSSAGINWNSGLSAAILNSEVGPSVHHHLLANPEELDRINSLDPVMSAVEVGRLEAKLSANKSAVKLTNAPPPPDISTGGSASADKDPSKMSQKEYEEWRFGG
ncbi:MAG: hypothetical protein GY938_18010 [Ketobacter sp.]|nr:hypothetical protein [Ketobacter sp.]